MTEKESQMTLLGHINELRKRLLVCVIALALSTLASFAFSQKIAEYLAEPIGGLQSMASIDVTENMGAFMKISLLSGVILAIPVILNQVLAFIMPGLKQSERKWIWMAIPLATIFFVAGIAFAYFVMLPAALPFLINFMGIETSPRPKTYFSFVTNLMFWVGLIFELPLLMYILARLRIVTAKMLVKQWRVALIASAIVAALITPTADPVNMGLMMLPLFVLYLVSILFAVIAGHKSKEKENLKSRKWLKRSILILLTIVVVTILLLSFLKPDESLAFLFIIRDTILASWHFVIDLFTSLGK